MKGRRLFAAVFFAASALVSAQAPHASDFQITRIIRNLIATPEFNYSGGETFRTNERDRWLSLEVEFTAQPEFTDEATFKYYILLGGKLLTGEVTHVNILAGKELHSAMYVPPRALAHIMGNRAFTANSVQNVAVQLLVKGEVKDELSLVRARPQWFSALPAMSGFVLNKNETPFAPLYWDHYEQIKPAGAR
ncbi:MAG: hypothetical protein H0X34_15080 [Chthoniobacterales bacterium]|nr:hypothetical protein [Chthoniobacterales bacterium]